MRLPDRPRPLERDPDFAKLVEALQKLAQVRQKPAGTETGPAKTLRTKNRSIRLSRER